MTIQNYFILTDDGMDCVDSEIEVPYSYISYIDKPEDDYDRFIKHICENVYIDCFNSSSKLLVCRFIEYFKKHLNYWIEFTNKINKETYIREVFDNDEDFIYDALCPTLENMLIGNYSDEDYKFFMSIVD